MGSGLKNEDKDDDEEDEDEDEGPEEGLKRNSRSRSLQTPHFAGPVALPCLRFDETSGRALDTVLRRKRSRPSQNCKKPCHWRSRPPAGRCANLSPSEAHCQWPEWPRFR